MRAFIVTPDMTGMATEVFRFSRSCPVWMRVDMATCGPSMLKGMSSGGEFIGSICDALGSLSTAVTMQEAHGGCGVLAAFCMPLLRRGVDDGSYAYGFMPDVSDDLLDAARDCVRANYMAARFDRVFVVGDVDDGVPGALESIGLGRSVLHVPDAATALSVCRGVASNGF